MKQVNKTQIIFIIVTLITGIFYLLFKSEGATYPGLEVPRAQGNNLNIANWTTRNNIPVYFVSARELPMIDISVTFRAGSAYSPNQPGVASLTNIMLGEGTKNYDTEEISEIFESIGAEYSSSAGRDSAELSLRSLVESSKLTSALKIYLDILANPNFPNKSFNRVKNNAIESLKLAEQYPETILNKTFFQNIYNEHPYAVPIDGNIETVSKITRDDLLSFYTKYYVTGNAMITMVGDFDINQAKEVAEQISQNIKPGMKSNNLPEVTKLADSYKQHVDFPSTQTHILVGGIGIKRDDPDYFALQVGNHVLGRMPLTSKLFKNVRIEKGLAYSVYSSFVAMQGAGPFLINMQTRNEKADEALQTTIATLTDFINNGPSQEELEMAKQNLMGSFPLSISSNSKKLSVISTIGFYNLPLDYLDTYIGNINKVTVEDVKMAFNRHVNLNKLAIVTVGNSQNAKNNLDGSSDNIESLEYKTTAVV